MAKQKKIKENQSQKKYYYPIHNNPEKSWEVTLVEITEVQYRSIYPEIWAMRKREQEHGRCMCPKRYFWKCDGICSECEYHAPSDMLSTDLPAPDGKGNMYDTIPDERQLIEEITSDQMELEMLIKRFRELDPEADRIIKLLGEGYSDRKIARTIGRKERTFADQMKKIRTELRKTRGY